MKKSNWLWGIFFIGAAVAIVFNQLGFLTNLSLVNLVLLILMVPVIIMSTFSLNFGGVFFPVAILGIAFAKPLGIEELVPWPILVVALFATIGFSLIFKRKPHSWHHHFQNVHQRIEDSEEDDEVNFNVSFGSGAKYITSSKLKRANIGVSFGAAQVYFDNAKIDPKGAEIYVDVSFGGVELFFPREWNVEISTDAFLGGVDEKNKRYSEKTGPKVMLKGKVSLSGIEITYI